MSKIIFLKQNMNHSRIEQPQANNQVYLTLSQATQTHNQIHRL